MVLQMPRFGQTKIFDRIFINPTLDLSNLQYNTLKECEVCGAEALHICAECAGTAFGREKRVVFFCESCVKLMHKHSKREKHKPKKLVKPESYVERGDDVDKAEMELFGVVCIATSHYVAFVKCGEGVNEQWVFFDSMADRIG